MVRFLSTDQRKNREVVAVADAAHQSTAKRVTKRSSETLMERSSSESEKTAQSSTVMEKFYFTVRMKKTEDVEVVEGAELPSTVRKVMRKSSEMPMVRSSSVSVRTELSLMAMAKYWYTDPKKNREAVVVEDAELPSIVRKAMKKSSVTPMVRSSNASEKTAQL